MYSSLVKEDSILLLNNNASSIHKSSSAFTLHCHRSDGSETGLADQPPTSLLLSSMQKPKLGFPCQLLSNQGV